MIIGLFYLRLNIPQRGSLVKMAKYGLAKQTL